MALVLSGDDFNDPQDLTDAEVNHLRRLLAWFSLEHGLGEEMMRGYLEGARVVVQVDPSSSDRVQKFVDERIARIERVPKYIRQAVKMLQKAVRDHDRGTRVVDSPLPATQREGE